MFLRVTIYRQFILPEWIECDGCGAIAMSNGSDSKCRSCRVGSDDFNDFVRGVFVNEPDVLPPLDKFLLLNYVSQKFNDYHAREPIDTSHWLTVGADVTQSDSNNNVCPICIEPMARGVEITAVCKHRAHRECMSMVVPGVVMGVRCPVCRTPVSRCDLPWDTSVHALVSSVRRVERVLDTMRTSDDDVGIAAKQENVSHHDVYIYHVCAMQIVNALIDHRHLQWSFTTNNCDADTIDRWLAAHVRRIQRDNTRLESALHIVNSE